MGKKSNRIIVGPPGPMGPVGPEGPQGPAGPAGSMDMPVYGSTAPGVYFGAASGTTTYVKEAGDRLNKFVKDSFNNGKSSVEIDAQLPDLVESILDELENRPGVDGFAKWNVDLQVTEIANSHISHLAYIREMLER